METESQARGTQLEGTVLLPDGRLRAVEVFGKAEKAHSWLDTVNSQFNGLTPRAAAQTKEGKEQVLGILFDLEHGFPA
jgi:uncharacterized protein (DUF2384 family)